MPPSVPRRGSGRQSARRRCAVIDMPRCRAPRRTFPPLRADAVGLRAGRADHRTPSSRRAGAAAGGRDRTSTSAAARSCSSPASRRACTTSCATCRSRRSAQKANQLESMTIELVAMLFDFIFETRDLPDGIKALLARLQIPVLKAAMLDGAFFAKKTHPSRLLVNALAEAGLGWSPAMGTNDPLYRRSTRSSTGSSTGSPTTSRSSTSCARSWRAFLAEEEKAAEANIQSTAEEIDQQRPAADRDRRRRRPRSSGASRGTRSRTSSRRSCASSGGHARGRLPEAGRGERGVERRRSRRSRTSSGACSRSARREDRKHLVALLPSLLKRLVGGVQDRGWARERARAVHGEPRRGARGGGEAVARRRGARRRPRSPSGEGARPKMAKAAGDEAEGGARPRRSPRRWRRPSPRRSEPRSEIVDDEYLEIARASSAACGSSSRPTTASSRSRSSHG